jgi:hypothetical protein
VRPLRRVIQGDRLPRAADSKIFEPYSLPTRWRKCNLDTLSRRNRLAAPGESEKTRGNHTPVSANLPGERPSTLPLVWMETSRTRTRSGNRNH